MLADLAGVGAKDKMQGHMMIMQSIMRSDDQSIMCAMISQACARVHACMHACMQAYNARIHSLFVAILLTQTATLQLYLAYKAWPCMPINVENCSTLKPCGEGYPM